MSRRRVLVVEDNPLNRELITDVLEGLDCEVITAASAEEGLSRIEHGIPDLILLDMRLPGMSGAEAITAIRAHPELRRLPVIAVTAQATAAEQDVALRAGFDAHVSKPIDTRNLRALVRQHLQQVRAE